MIRKAIIYITVMIMVLMCGCGRQYETLESYVDSDEKYSEEINRVAEAEDIDVALDGNLLTLTYDFGEMDDYDLELYSSVLDGMGDELGKEMEQIIEEIESESHISDVTVKVVFTANGERIWEKEYETEED